MWITVQQTGEHAQLRVPGRDQPSVDRFAGGDELDRGLLTWDDEAATAIGREVAKRNEFSVVESVGRADYVLLAEAQYQTVASFSGRRGNSTGMVIQVGGDREANFLEALFALIVPAEEYGKRGLDVTSLLPVSLWAGAAFATSKGAFPRPYGFGPVVSGPLPRLGRLDPASAESLVTQLHDRVRRPPAFPPLCAPSEGVTSHQAMERPVFCPAPPAAEGADTASARLARHSALEPTFTTGVTYVSLPVVVADAKGRAVGGLAVSDFSVFEDDVEQRIDRVMAVSAPFDVALLVDTSASMRAELVQLHNAILQFNERLPSGSRSILVAFDDRVSAQADFMSDREHQSRAVSEMWEERGQGTRLYDAIDLVMSRRLDAIPGRKAIVLFTDGVDTRSRLASRASTQGLISQSQVPVYVVQYDTSGDDYSLPYGIEIDGMTIRDMQPQILPEGAKDNRTLFSRANSYLTALADLSGGRLYHTGKVRSLTGAFAQIARDLGEQYTVCYYPTNTARDGKYRSIRVEVHRPDVTVRTRPGYRGASPAVR